MNAHIKTVLANVFQTAGGGGGTGDVTGPVSSVANNFASFLDASGQIIKDSGFSAASFIKQGANTLTQSLGLDGAQNIRFGFITPITNFSVTNSSGSVFQVTGSNVVITTSVSSADFGSALINLIGPNNSAVNQFKLGTIDAVGPVWGAKLIVGGVDRFSITEAGVFKFLGAVAPSVGQVPTATNIDGTWTWQTPSGGGGGTPGGSTTEIQFNNASAFDGNPFFTIVDATGVVTLGKIPVFTLGLGSAIATTQSALDNSTKIATTAYADGAVTTASLPNFDITHDGYVLQSGGAGRILKGDGTWLSIGANTFILTSDGTTFSWAAPTVNPATTDGDLIQWSSGAYARIPDVATGNALISGGVAGLWTAGKISLTSHISGTLAVGNGGVGLTTYTVGDVLSANTSSSLSAIAAVGAGAFLRAAGAATLPVWSTLILPNAATSTRIIFASATNTYGESANLTFVTNRLIGTTLYLTLSAGTASAGTGPFIMTSGTNLTTALAGCMEYDGTTLFFTRTGTTRESILTGITNVVSPTAPNRTIQVVVAGTTLYIAAKTTND